MKGHVTYKPAGRLGNVMFQVAACIGYARLHGLEFSMPSFTDNTKWNPLYFPWLVKKEFDKTLPSIVLREPHHHYAPVPFKEKYRGMNIVLEGYWQSEKYFEHCKDEIIQAFRLPHEYINYVGIHIRRGDYLQYQQKHILQTPSWLRQCVYHFVERGFKSFVVCSDGIKWAKETLDPLRVGGAEFSYSEGIDEIGDLALISCCRHQIISSSTFGWWGAYLNPNPDKIVLIPDKWFGPSESKLSTKDIVPDSWIKIPI